MSEATSTASTGNDLLVVDVQIELSEDEPEEPPSSQQLSQWANAAYARVAKESAELALRITSAKEMAELNSDYRGKSGPTNVLSFPVDSSDLPPELAEFLLGDIVSCHPVVVSEATEQSKSVQDHYAHMVTHGVLHLCGYDHVEEEPAQRMEQLEIDILGQQGIPNPYA